MLPQGFYWQGVLSGLNPVSRCEGWWVLHGAGRLLSRCAGRSDEELRDGLTSRSRGPVALLRCSHWAKGEQKLKKATYFFSSSFGILTPRLRQICPSACIFPRYVHGGCTLWGIRSPGALHILQRLHFTDDTAFCWLLLRLSAAAVCSLTHTVHTSSFSHSMSKLSRIHQGSRCGPFSLLTDD